MIERFDSIDEVKYALRKVEEIYKPAPQQETTYTGMIIEQYETASGNTVSVVENGNGKYTMVITSENGAITVKINQAKKDVDNYRAFCE